MSKLRRPAAPYVDPSIARAKAVKVQVVYQDRSSNLKVVSDTPMAPADAKKAAEMFSTAYQAAKDEAGWDSAAQQKLSGPLELMVLSKPALDKVLGFDSAPVSGTSLEAGLVIVPQGLAARATPDDWDTLVHESTHNQRMTVAGDDYGKIPRWQEEGDAYVSGDEYPVAQKMTDPVLGGLAGDLTKFKGDDARWVMSHYSTARAADRIDSDPTKGYESELVGALFVEWLRADKAIPDAVARFAKVAEDVGAGRSYESAFHTEFGMTMKDASAQYASFVEQTEGDGKARLANTLWAPYLS